MIDFEQTYEQILREVFTELQTRLKRSTKARNAKMGDFAVNAALTRAIVLGFEAGRASEAQRLNAKWRDAVEQATGQVIELEYQPPAPIEMPDVWTALYGTGRD